MYNMNEGRGEVPGRLKGEIGMKKKSKKQINNEVYDRCIHDYKYDSIYNPGAEMGFDNWIDKYLYYGTENPKFDKNDYAAHPMRAYKKKDEKTEEKKEDK